MTFSYTQNPPRCRTWRTKFNRPKSRETKQREDRLCASVAMTKTVLAVLQIKVCQVLERKSAHNEFCKFIHTTGTRKVSKSLASSSR